jgi:hypothetical protein
MTHRLGGGVFPYHDTLQSDSYAFLRLTFHLDSVSRALPLIADYIDAVLGSFTHLHRRLAGST